MDSHISGGEQCSRPPALDDLDLVAAVDGEARPDILAHLSDCDYCAARAGALARIQHALRQRLFRAFCPTSDDLVAFHHQQLSEPRQAAVASHLDECPHCARELQLIVRAAREPPALANSFHRVVAQRVPAAIPSGAAALYGAARAAAGSAQYAYRAENLEITLRVARAVAQPGQLVLSGHLATDDSALEEALIEATASLLAHEGLLAVAPLDELGGFLFDNVAPGEYQLALRLGECEVIVESLAV